MTSTSTNCARTWPVPCHHSGRTCSSRCLSTRSPTRTPARRIVRTSPRDAEQQFPFDVAAAPSPAEPGRPGSLTEWLRARTDAELAELLRRRPDLALPAPPDLATLAARLGIRTSVQRAVDGLNAFELYVLESLVLAGADVSIDEFADAAEVGPAIDDLIATGLVWGE